MKEKKMTTLTKNGDKVVCIENFLSNKECLKWIKKIPHLGPGLIGWKHRSKDITTSPVVKKVQDCIKKYLKKDLKINDAQAVVWNEESFSALHVHTQGGRDNTEYNSILYLNDNFEGGRFITQGEIRMKPKRGMLTIFDGRKMYHGVSPVTKGSRFALNFWWKK